MYNDRMKKYSDETLIADLIRVAKEQGCKAVTFAMYRKHRKYSPGAYIRAFGTWNNALLAAGLQTNHFKRPLANGYKRDKIPLSIKEAITKRDRNKCCICGASPANDPTVKLQFDHIIPVSRGGETTIENLWLLCEKCNLSKLNSTYPDIIVKAKWHMIDCALREERLKRAKKVPFDRAEHLQKMLKIATKPHKYEY